MQTVHWKLSHLNLGISAAVVSDVHNRNHEKIFSRVLAEKPDIILIPGDLFSALNPEERHYAPSKRHPNAPGFELLSRFSALAPTYLSLGNHESWVTEENRAKIAATGAVLLEDSFVNAGSFLLGGLNSVMTPGDHRHTPPPNTAFLAEFAAQKGKKILLCHHPEVFDDHISHLDVDLVISGHAHGGQWRIGNQGIWAPGQGLFPRYTKGIYRDSLVVGPGLSNHTWVPRIFNPETVIILHM